MVQKIGAEVYEVAVTQGWIDDADRDFPPGTPRRPPSRCWSSSGC